MLRIPTLRYALDWAILLTVSRATPSEPYARHTVTDQGNQWVATDASGSAAMPSHKSPSSRRYAEATESREILATRRATAESRKEGTSYHFATAYPKHPKAGRIFTNPNSPHTITFGGKKQMGPMFNPSRVTREITRPLSKMNWELTVPSHWNT